MKKQDIEKYGFKESSKNYFMKDAPGHLGYYTEVILDNRFEEEKFIYGVRGVEVDILFRGSINIETLEIILKSVKAI